MKIVELSEIYPDHKLRLLELWNREYPAKLRLKGVDDLEQFYMGLTDINHAAILDGNQKVMGWYSDFIRDDERWFLMILDDSIQGKGYGRKLIDRAKYLNDSLNGWVIDHHNDAKINGDTYHSPLAFYLKHDFVLIPEIRLETDHISAVKIHWEA